MKKELIDQIKPGASVRIWERIKEGEKERTSKFQGVVLAVKHGKEAGATFTVRRVASGVGVEKIFPLYSPMIEDVKILKRAKVRRAKLYHIRTKAAKEISRQMRNVRMSKDEPETAAPVEAPAEAATKKVETAK